MRSCARRLGGLSLLTLLCAAPAAAQFKSKLSTLKPLAKKEAWSPDSRAVLFDRAAPLGGDLWLLEGVE